MDIEVVDSISLLEYDEFLLNCPNSLLYQSSNYLSFIKALTEAKLLFFTLKENNVIMAIMPVFLKSTKYGNVINSLPFYGSNGAVLVQTDNAEYKKKLLKFYKEYLDENKILVSTIIVSPFECDASEYEKVLIPNYTDERIGQLTPLLDSVESLFESFHYKTRNSIRKGEKSGIEISCEDGIEYFDFLFETHKENITSIGGSYKPKRVFDLFKANFEYGKDYKIFVAKINGKPVSALLNFYFNKTVEYYTPVTVKEYREAQPLSAIIWFAMQDAVRNNYKWWNWGGTWITQKGVYDFKKRWGTKDFNYKYFINTVGDEILNIPKSNILNEFKYFYTIPFHLLKQ